MKKNEKFLSLVFFLPIFLYIIYDPNPIQTEIIGILGILLVVVMFFEILDRNRDKRIGEWEKFQESKFQHAVKFSLLIGLPLSLLLSLLIISKSNFIHSLVFIIIPITFLFGWIGAWDWQQCYKLYLEKKYSNKFS